MSVSDELQNIIADTSAAIAARRSYTRVDLEKLRRRLGETLHQAQQDERVGVISRMALTDLCDGVDAGVLDLAGRASQARRAISAEAVHD